MRVLIASAALVTVTFGIRQVFGLFVVPLSDALGSGVQLVALAIAVQNLVWGFSSPLFGALADSGKIKQRKNGSYRMVLKGVDEIDWFTDRPDRVEGTWKPQKLLRKWNKLFANSKPNAQATVEVEDQRELFTFEMFKPKMKSGKMMFNVKPLSDSSEDKVTGIAGKSINNISDIRKHSPRHN